jgi:hypothetical protein
LIARSFYFYQPAGKMNSNMAHLTPMESAIWRTVCWFAVFEYPLTVFDMYKWMIDPPEDVRLSDVYATLDSSKVLTGNLVQQDGFYLPAALPEAKRVFDQRHDRFLDAMRKYARLKTATRYIGKAPGVRGVAAVNTLGWWHTDAGSDIDMLIIARPDRLWTARFLSVLPFLLMRKRPGAQASANDPLCFSFYLSEDALDVEKLCLDDDPYFHYWLYSAVPIFESGGVIQRVHETNEWARARLPHTKLPNPPERICAQSHGKGFALGAGVERFLRWVQRKRLPEHIRERAEDASTHVVVDDAMLKFHTNDRRAAYREDWKRMQDVFLTEVES